MVVSPAARRALSRTADDFASARTPPGWVYADPALFDREQQVLFSEGWLALGHESGFATPGVHPLTFGSESLLLATSEAAPPRLFFNVCRHRGTRLLTDSVSACRLIVCPYHGWAYGTDGSLKAAPGMDGQPGFNPAAYALREVPLYRWNGLLFANPAANQGNTPPVPALAADLSRLVLAAHHQYRVAANWKLLCENYNECYHCPGAHPELHRLTRVDSGQERVQSDGFTGGPMRLRRGVETMSDACSQRLSLLPGVTDPERVEYFHLYPNLFLSVMPDYAMLHLLWPHSAEETQVETCWLVNPSDQAREGFSIEDVVTFWDRTNRQDWALCENAMAGLRSRGHKSGPYHPDEVCVHDFDRWYVRRLFHLDDAERA